MNAPQNTCCVKCGHRWSSSESPAACPLCGYVDEEEVVAVGRIVSGGIPTGRSRAPVTSATTAPASSPRRWLLLAFAAVGAALLVVAGTLAWLGSSQPVATTPGPASPDPASENNAELPPPNPMPTPPPPAEPVAPPPPARPMATPPMPPPTSPPPASTPPTKAPARPRPMTPTASSSSPNVGGAPQEWFTAVGGVRFYSDERPRWNGVALPAGEWFTRPWVLVPGQGKHLLARGESESVIDVPQSFVDYYQQHTRGWRTADGKWNFDLLFATTQTAPGVFSEPLLAHAWGNYYWQEKDAAAAERCWRTAVRLEPGFAPAYLNLAFARLARKELEECRRELALAREFNRNDAYGLAEHLLELYERARFEESWQVAPQYDARRYLPPQEELSVEGQQAVGFYENYSLYALRPEQKAAAINNAGVYLLRVARQPQGATARFLEALAVLEQPTRREADSSLRKTILQNLTAAAGAAKFGEVALFRQLGERLP